MIEKLANNLVDQMMNENLIDIEKKENYVYAFTYIVEHFLTIGTIIVISLILKNFLYTLIFLGFFLSLRKRTGGYHADTFLKCYFGTIITYIFISYVSTLLSYNVYILHVLLILSIITIGFIGTINHPNMDMDSYELIESKKAARLILILESGLIYFLVLIRVDINAINYMSMAVILCALLLLIAKILNQEVKENE